MPESDLDALLKLSGDIDGVHKVRAYGRIGQMALEYDEPRRASVLDALGAVSYTQLDVYKRQMSACCAAWQGWMRPLLPSRMRYFRSSKVPL